MEGGVVVEEAKPQEFFTNPKTERAKKFLGKFSGTNAAEMGQQL
jgi:polar amino acid transport system ATP-binding protein